MVLKGLFSGLQETTRDALIQDVDSHQIVFFGWAHELHVFLPTAPQRWGE